MKNSLAAAALLALGLLPVSSPAEEYKLTFVTSNLPGTTLIKGANMLVDRVNEYTNGQVKLKLNTSMLIGAELAPAVRDGMVDMVGVVNAYVSTSEPMMGLQNLPGIIGNRAQYQAALNAGWRDKINSAWLNNWNAVKLAEGNMETNVLITRKPVVAIKDFSRMKLRVFDPISAQLIGVLGAVPTPLDPSDIAAGLERGIIDGLFTGVCIENKLEFWRGAKNNSDWNISTMQGWSLLANKASWAKLPPDLQAKVIAAGQSVEKELRDTYDAHVADCVNSLKSHGVVFNEVPEDQLKAALAPQNTDPLINRWLDQAKAKGYDDADAFLSKIREAVLAAK